jgi:hypothetical protein
LCGDYPDLSLRLFEQSYWELVVLGKHQLLLVLQIIQTQFDNPIVVPAGVERILVTVSKFKNLYDPTVAEILVAGTTVDTGESCIMVVALNALLFHYLLFQFQMQIFSSTLLVRLAQKSLD